MKPRRHPDRPLSRHAAEVAAEWHPWLNGDLTPEWVAVASNKRVWWRCRKGHVWLARVCDRTRPARPSGCPTCDDLSGGTLAALRPDLAAELDPTRNAGLTADLIACRGSKPVAWVCAAGHQWVTTPKHRVVDGSGCPTCDDLAGGTVADVRPDLVAEWDDNNDHTPDLTAARSDKPTRWICRACGHRWVTSPKHRVGNRSGCPECANQARSVSRAASWAAQRT